MTGTAPPPEPDVAYPQIPPPPPLGTYPGAPGGVYPPPYSPEARPQNLNDTSGLPGTQLPTYPANTKIGLQSDYVHATHTTYTTPSMTSNQTQVPSESIAVPISSATATQPVDSEPKYWGHFGVGVLFGFFFAFFSFLGLCCIDFPRPKKYYSMGCGVGLIAVVVLYVVVGLTTSNFYYY